MARKKKKEEPKLALATLLVGYEEHYLSGGEPEDPDDRWTSHSDEFRDFKVTGVWRNRDNAPWMVESCDVDFEVSEQQYVFVLVVRYSTGSTFGRICGCGHIEGVYKTPEEAGAVEKKIYNNTYEGYAPWIGYFESLEDVQIECEPVR